MSMMLSKTQQEIQADELRNDKVREILHTEPVKRSVVPRWFYERLVSEFGRSGRYTAVKGALLVRAFGDDPLLIDHWGTSVIGGRKLFVLEPFSSVVTDLKFSQLAAVARERLFCRCWLDSNSHHMPGHTLRIVFDYEGAASPVDEIKLSEASSN